MDAWWGCPELSGCPGTVQPIVRTVASVSFVVDKDAFAEVLRSATNGRSVRSLAERSGWGRSTVHDWLTGVRLPSERQLEDLLGAVGAPLTVVGEVQRLRAEAAARVGPVVHLTRPDAAGPSGQISDTGANTSSEGASAATTTALAPVPAGMGKQHAPAASGLSPAQPLLTLIRPARRINTLLLAGMVVVVAVASFGGGFVAGRVHNSQTPQPPALPQARVQGTLGKGLISHRGPDGATERVGSLYENQLVTVACISPTGSNIEDDTMHESRHDWALLGDGTWVSVLYLDIHSRWTPPQPPPPPFTIC